jgi:hypothetical protein
VGKILGDLAGHGTCGNIGIMTKGTLVSMKAADDNDDLAEEGIWNAFGLAIDDIVDNGRQGRSVINISVGCKSIIYKMTFVRTNSLVIIT